MRNSARTISSTLAILTILASTPHPALAGSGFTLSSGIAEAVLPEHQEIVGALFSVLTIDIYNNGEVTGKADVPLAFEGGACSYTGTASFNLEGTYDFATRRLSGTFNYAHQRTEICTYYDGSTSDPDEDTRNSSGEFDATAEGDSLKIKFPQVAEVTYFGIPDPEGLVEIADIAINGLSGTVEWRPGDDEEAWNFARLGDNIPPGAHIRVTGADSAVHLGSAYWSNGEYVLKPAPGKDSAELEIYKAPEDSKPGVFKLLWGGLYSNIKKTLRGGSIYEGEGSQAAATIKGTVYVLIEDEGETTVMVIEGEVQVTSLVTGEEVFVETGEMVVADEDGLQPTTTFDVATEEAKWESSAQQESPAESLQPQLPDTETLVFLTAAGGVVLLCLGGISLLIVVGGIVFLLRRRWK